MIYVGSSKNINNRILNHKYNLKKNTHSNHHLQSDFNLYGIDSFTFEILEKCKDGDHFGLEQKYLDELMPFYKLGNGYNIAEIAGGMQTSGFRFFVNGTKLYIKQNGYPVPMPITYEEYIYKTREQLCEECEGFTTLDYLEEDLLLSDPNWND